MPAYEMLREQLASQVSFLPDKPEENADSTLRALWCAAVGTPRSAQMAVKEELKELSPEDLQTLEALVVRRISGVPLAHITGRQQFMGMEMLAGPEALVPRHETELLATTAIRLVREVMTANAAPTVIDVCTGSGNVALAIGHHIPGARVFAADLSESAVDLARRNATHLRLDDRVKFSAGDLLAPFDTAAFLGCVDVLTCNPPYITTGKVERMPSEIAAHEPRLAFDGGALGISILMRLIQDAPRFLRPGGWLAFEVGLGQGPGLVKRLSASPSYKEVVTAQDEAGAVRVVAGALLSTTGESTGEDRGTNMAGAASVAFSADVLKLDEEAEITRIAASLREATGRTLRKRGLIVAISGGVDSSVCAALAVRAVGAQKVCALILPERDSSGHSASRAETLAAQLGLQPLTVNIGATLEAVGCYRWRDEAMRRVLPGYDESWRSKIAIRGGMQGRVSYFHLIAQSPDGEIHDVRMALPEYLQIVAATSFKQRTRKMIEYFHADRLNYAVVGTPNRLEYDQGFFVKTGDGAADLKPIAHLYKTQVYALARAFDLPAEITSARPTTDTYSLAQGQDEFYFALPYEQMDLALWAHNHGVPAAQMGAVLGLTADRAQWIYDDIEAKRRATQYLHRGPVLVEDVPEITF